MEFIDDFIALTPRYYYVSLCFLLFFTAGICGGRRFVGPVAVSSVYFYGAVLLMMGGGDQQFCEGVILILCYLFFLFFGVRAPLIRFSRSKLAIEDNVGLYTRMALVVLFLYSIFLGFLLFKYAQDFRVDKINWVGDAGGLPYLLALFNGLLVSLFFVFLVMRKYFLSAVIGVSLIVGGSMFGEKGVIINLALVLMVAVFQRPVRLLNLLGLFFLLVAISALTVVFFFGGASASSGDAILAFLARLAASFDGTMIILETNMYEYYRLPNSVLYYIFDFVFSKIYGISPGVGQILAAANVYSYPVNGGPNDSLINYFLLSGVDGKIIVVGFVCVFSFVLGMLDNAVKTCRLNSYTLGWQFVLLPLYFYMPIFFQATGTAFLLLARYYVFLMPLVFVVFVFRGVTKNVKFK